jgi:predicted ATPase
MFVKKLVIYDYENKEANSFEFSERVNVICSEDNSIGKSCLLKSLYYALGLDIKTFSPGWNYKKILFKVYYEHNGKTGYIVRAESNFGVKGRDINLNVREYSSWFSNILGLKMKLPLKDKEEMQDVYVSVPLSLFYIDQDSSWNKAIYKHTV